MMGACPVTVSFPASPPSGGYGPQRTHINALLDSVLTVTAPDCDILLSLTDPHAPAYIRARDNAWYASLYAGRNVEWIQLAREAEHACLPLPPYLADRVSRVLAITARAVLVRDRITSDDYTALTRPWRAAIGSIHPDDTDPFDTFAVEFTTNLVPAAA